VYTRRRRRRSFSQLWHGLPWNGLFWLMCGTLFAAGAAFAVRAEQQIDLLVGVHAGEEAHIAAGDLVTAVFILNGDELVVEKNGARAKVRLLGIKSFDPVVNEREITAYGDASVRFLTQWLLNKKVHFEFDAPIKDDKGRYLAYVYLDDIEINRRMVADGVSMVYTEYETAREREYFAAELSARHTGIGVWGGRKSRLRIEGLRREWANGREARNGEVPMDPLLMEER
jgi:micrococcal nuclease